MIARIFHTLIVFFVTTWLLWFVWRAATALLQWPAMPSTHIAVALLMVWLALGAFELAKDERA